MECTPCHGDQSALFLVWAGQQGLSPLALSVNLAGSASCTMKQLIVTWYVLLGGQS